MILLIAWFLAALGGLLAAAGGVAIYVWNGPSLIEGAQPEDPLFTALANGIALGLIGIGLYITARSAESYMRLRAKDTWRPRPGWENEPYPAPPTPPTRAGEPRP